MQTRPGGWSKIRTAIGIVLSTALLGTGFAGLTGLPAAQADTAPTSPTTPETVSADPLPTWQVTGVVWGQVDRREHGLCDRQLHQGPPAGHVAGRPDRDQRRAPDRVRHQHRQPGLELRPRAERPGTRSHRDTGRQNGVRRRRLHHRRRCGPAAHRRLRHRDRRADQQLRADRQRPGQGPGRHQRHRVRRRGVPERRQRPPAEPRRVQQHRRAEELGTVRGRVRLRAHPDAGPQQGRGRRPVPEPERFAGLRHGRGRRDHRGQPAVGGELGDQGLGQGRDRRADHRRDLDLRHRLRLRRRRQLRGRVLPRTRPTARSAGWTTATATPTMWHRSATWPTPSAMPTTAR